MVTLKSCTEDFILNSAIDITKPCLMSPDIGVLYLGFQLLLYISVLYVLKKLLPE